MKNKFAVTVLLILILLNIPASSQVTQQWVRSYNTDFRDIACKVVTDKFTGDIYMCGESNYKLLVFKYSSDGRLIWSKSFSSITYVNDMILDNLGGLIILGSTNLDSHNFDFLTIKYSTDGNLIWYKKYNGPDKKNDWPVALATDGQGGIMVTGNIENKDLFYDALVIKYDINGFTEWTQIFKYYADNDNKVSSISVDGSGNIYLTVNAGINIANIKWITIKYSSRGNLEWYRCELSEWGMKSIQVINAEELGRVFSIGFDFSERKKIKVKCYDRLGNLQWYNEYDYWTTFTKGVFDDRYNRMYLYGSFSEYSRTKFRLLAINAEEEGKPLWSDLYNGQPNTSYFSSDITLGSDHNIYVTGRQQRFPNVSDFLTVKYGFDGNRLWEKIYNYSGTGNESALSLCTDNSGNIYVLGNSQMAVDDYGMTLVKYSQGILPRFSSEIPSSFKLHQNYPNPFNPSTQIKYDLPYDADVKITVYDMLGKELAVLVNEQKTAGSSEVSFDASQFSSGMYFYKIEAGSYSETKKMMLVK